MPFIVLVELKPMTQRLALVKLYMDLVQVHLGEASERIGGLFYHGNRAIEVADWAQAAHFVYQARQYGAVFRLRAAAPLPDEATPPR
ncbi:hypothetical protein EJV47_18200 [Hymenobacter gummosus]|uniref:Uncharacterized protein n=1 Tax=Hymenobacter gummosus TaxID=1776032 RepID=A0A431U0D0_9BACT|nr:hypothetical protein [Hymenobacter gummosus]RTQ47851.1 hypothetical protein EJV47_18200 [Hymenobacter gummosus]